MKSVSENYMVLQNGGDADGKISKASDKKTDATVLKKIRYFSVRKLIFFVLAIIWMVVIYMYSSRNAELSTADSHEVGMIIGQVTVSDFEDWTYEQQYSYAEQGHRRQYLSRHVATPVPVLKLSLVYRSRSH